MNVNAFGGTAPISPALTIAPLDAPAPTPKRKPRPKGEVKPAIMPAANTNLTEDIDALTARLGKSLGVVPGPTGHDPDMFVRALGRAHATLTEVRADLGKWQDQLSEREQALQAREQAVQGRERQAEALASLANLLGPGDPSTATQTAMPKSTVAKWIRRWLGL